MTARIASLSSSAASRPCTACTKRIVGSSSAPNPGAAPSKQGGERRGRCRSRSRSPSLTPDPVERGARRTSSFVWHRSEGSCTPRAGGGALRELLFQRGPSFHTFTSVAARRGVERKRGACCTVRQFLSLLTSARLRTPCASPRRPPAETLDYINIRSARTRIDNIDVRKKKGVSEYLLPRR